jgi:hypothetical protein
MQRILMPMGRFFARQLRIPRSHFARLVGLAAVIFGLLLASSAKALLVGVTPGTVPNTSTNPALPGSGWTQGDPGWANVGKNGSLNGVYIGDSWILTAHHAGVSAMQFDTGDPIPAIPGQDFQIMNVPGSGLTPGADLRLFRVSGIPAGMSAITIASTPPLLSGNINGEVMYIGNGLLRAANESFFDVNAATDPDTWTELPGVAGAERRGYWTFGVGKRWGTNRIANDNILPGEGDANFTHNVNNSTISYLTTYDQSGGTAFESQAVGGDSGGGVFFNRNQGTALPPLWELVGITINNFIFDGQSTASFNPNNSLGIYDNATAFVDLSSYRTEILTIMAAHQNYSIMGDVNLDGVVSGDGTGIAATDDVTAFVQGWRYQQAQGNVVSWKKGDLNRDGVTNVSDFLLLRNGLQAAGLSANLAAFDSLFSSSGGVPEPATAALALLGAAIVALRRQRR